jgi:hypothetical protein
MPHRVIHPMSAGGPDEDASSLAHRTLLTGLQVLVFGALAQVGYSY